MKQKSIAIVAILSATMLAAVFTTTLPFGLKSAEGQSIMPCPVGYHRNILVTVVPDLTQCPVGFHRSPSWDLVNVTLYLHQTNYLHAKADQNKILFVVDSHIHVDNAENREDLKCNNTTKDAKVFPKLDSL